MVDRCPVCESADREDVLLLEQVPVLVNAQVRPDVAPEVPRGDLDLVVCRSCGHLYNRAFDAGLLDYDASYENTLHYSPQFQEFARGLAARLIDTHGLAGEVVAELGSGPGHFLSMLCEAGAGSGIGYDPSYDPARFEAPGHPSVTISTDPFPSDGSLNVGFAFSQHVLEHLVDPVAALVAQRVAVAETGGLVYSEVPNGGLMLEQCALWDLVYEHVSYFVPASLELACRRAGLSVSTTDTSFGDQFLWTEARSSHGGAGDPRAVADPDVLVAAARRFGAAASQRLVDAHHELEARAELGPVAMWGAGSKGMTYLNLVARDGLVSAVIDVNPRKTGWGVPGTDLVISDPPALAEIQPATVLIANPVYAREIGAQLADLGIHTELLPLWGEV